MPAGANAIARASQTIANELLEHSRDTHAGTLGFAPSCNLAIRREALEDLRFDERFPLAAGEDRAWSDRARVLGRPPAWEPGGIVIHHQRLTLASFARQQAGYGRGAARYRSLPDGGGRRPVSPRFVAGLVAAGFAQGARVGALVGAAQALTAAGLAAELTSGGARQHRRGGAG